MKSNYVDPNKIPKRELYTGAEMPAIGLGTFGSDSHNAQAIADAVKEAIRSGYRHIDCASVYGNEKEIGQAIREVIEEGTVTRKELWITSKVWNDSHDRVIESCEQSLADLQLDYLDLFLIHWPFPNHHAQGVTVDSRDPHAKPYIHEDYMRVWQDMEKLVDAGKVRHIGTSNMSIPKMELLLRDCRIKPACNEMELHPHFQQTEFLSFLTQKGIQAIGFCPIGSPNRPERDKTPEDTVPIEDPVIVRIAQKHNVHPAVICVKWGVQNGQVPIPFSVIPREFRSNLKSITEDPLTDEEMAAIKSIDKNCRFIKGQVFTWEGATWEDLWDTDGKIKGYQQ